MFGPEYVEIVGVVLWDSGEVLCVGCAEHEFSELVGQDRDAWLDWESGLNDQRSLIFAFECDGYYPDGLYCGACGEAIFEAELEE